MISKQEFESLKTGDIIEFKPSIEHKGLHIAYIDYNKKYKTFCPSIELIVNVFSQERLTKISSISKIVVSTNKLCHNCLVLPACNKAKQSIKCYFNKLEALDKQNHWTQFLFDAGEFEDI